jgi:hypothetical protein
VQASTTDVLIGRHDKCFALPNASSPSTRNQPGDLAVRARALAGFSFGAEHDIESRRFVSGPSARLLEQGAGNPAQSIRLQRRGSLLSAGTRHSPEAFSWWPLLVLTSQSRTGRGQNPVALVPSAWRGFLLGAPSRNSQSVSAADILAGMRSASKRKSTKLRSWRVRYSDRAPIINAKSASMPVAF